MRSSACRSPSPRRRRKRHGLPLYRYLGGTAARTAAGADDEHHQWRRACRQSDRLPGIHDHAGRRRRASPRRCAWASEIFHTLKKVLQERRPQHQCRRRRRLRAEPAVGRGGARLRHEGDRAGRLQAGRRRRARARLRRDRVLQGRGKYDIRRRGQDALDARSRSQYLADLCRAIRSSRSRTAWRKTIGTAGRC